MSDGTVRDDSLSALFEYQTHSTPDATAVACGSESLTFAELNARSNQLARYLTRRGIRPGATIGIEARRSTSTITCVIAAIKAGVTYVAIDPALPQDARDALLDDASASGLLSLGIGTDSASKCEVLVDLTTASPEIAQESSTNLQVVGSSEYVSIIYTSGTTGKPKGIPVTCRRVLHILRHRWSTRPFASDDVVLLHRSPMVTGFLPSCLAALLTGIPVVILSEAEARQPATIIEIATRHRATEMSAALGLWDSILRYLEAEPRAWSTLRLAKTGGEPVSIEMADRWKQVLPDVPLLVAYGTTECGTVAECDVTAAAAACRRFPAGFPIEGAEVYIVNSDLTPVESGAIGEICIGGDNCLGARYINNPELSAARFIHNPHAQRDGAIMFRTGDRGRWREDGLLEVIGRVDDQVKMRGFRVELGEIEAVLGTYPGIAGVAAVIRNNARGQARVVAYYACRAQRHVDPAQYRTHVSKLLPGYMVPTSFVEVESLPETISGKVNRRSLLRESTQDVSSV